MNSKIVLDAIKPKQGPDKKWKAMVPSKEVIGCVYETSLGQFTRNYTQTTKRGLLTTNKG